MRFSIMRRGGVVAFAAVGVLLAGVAPAFAAPGDGSAYGANVNVTLLGQPAVTVGPLAAASTAGPTSNSLASVAVPGILTTGVVNTSATLDPSSGTVTSDANVAGVGVPLLPGTPTIGAVDAHCVATQSGITGTTTLANVNLGALGTVAANPAPNTVINVQALGITIATITFNEQITNANGSLTVNAIHVRLLGGVLGSLGTGDVIVSSATCGPAALPVPMASGAGLWIGLGLLAAVGVPVGIRFVRRRQAANPA